MEIMIPRAGYDARVARSGSRRYSAGMKKFEAKFNSDIKIKGEVTDGGHQEPANDNTPPLPDAA